MNAGRRECLPVGSQLVQRDVSRRFVVSLVRIHNFSISLDGFVAGDGISSHAPFGHAGTRLHQWMFATRFGTSLLGGPGGSLGIDNALAERHDPGIGAEVMGRGKFGPQHRAARCRCLGQLRRPALGARPVTRHRRAGNTTPPRSSVSLALATPLASPRFARRAL